ncbi:MAG TPA: MotA/TolQ/ExbB proton channel family protein [Lentisphaeria bacterium]|jgi:biopolymer transport protein ExbB|nr:MotA/TolQ/ExbB proton channel family protein [Lentisphaeria bacterium]
MTSTYLSARHTLCLGLLFCLPVFAQEETAVTDPKIELQALLREGGTPMMLLMLLSVFATFMVVYYFLTLRINLLMPRAFHMEAAELASRGDSLALSAVCAESGCAGARIVGSAARMLSENPNADFQSLRDALEDEGSRQAAALWQRIHYLLDCAVVAPMLGLLGTVLGMMESFHGLAEDFGSVKPAVLASGVSQALVTTAGGMCVGIVGMVLYAYFRGRVTSLIAQLEERCNLVLQRLYATTHRQQKP